MGDQPKQPEHLTVVKTEETGLMSRILYAVDPQGNVWRTQENNGKQADWRLHLKAEDIPRPTLTFEQMVGRNN